MRKDLYIFRHGETDLNLQKKIQGSGMDFDLNGTGLKQATELCNKFTNIPLEIIFSSPLKRAIQTAEIVAQHKNISIIVQENLKECFYGEAEGMYVTEVQKKYPDIINNWSNPNVWNIKYPHGETKKEALDRVWNEINQIKNSSFNIIGIAIHGGTMSSLLNYLHFGFDCIGNCAVVHLVNDNNEWFVEGNLF